MSVLRLLGVPGMLTGETATNQYQQVLDAEPALQPVAYLVDALCELVREDDRMCAGCVWESIVKPLTDHLVGWGRGYPPGQANDESDRGPRFMTARELLAYGERRPQAQTQAEAWLRTSDAFDAFTGPLLRKLHAADPGNGHGVTREAGEDA